MYTRDTVELTPGLSSAKPTRIDSFLKLIAPFGILESARTGTSSVLDKIVLHRLKWLIAGIIQV